MLWCANHYMHTIVIADEVRPSPTSLGVHPISAPNAPAQATSIPHNTEHTLPVIRFQQSSDRDLLL